MNELSIQGGIYKFQDKNEQLSINQELDSMTELGPIKEEASKTATLFPNFAQLGLPKNMSKQDPKIHPIMDSLTKTGEDEPPIKKSPF